MDRVRDLAGAELWEESLERSRERRGVRPRSAERAPAADDLAPATTDPAPTMTAATTRSMTADPAPATTDPAPARAMTADPAPATTDPAPARAMTADPAPATAAEPAPASAASLWASGWQRVRRAIANRPLIAIAALAAVLALVLLTALLPGASDGRGDGPAAKVGRSARSAHDAPHRATTDMRLVVPAEGIAGQGANAAGTAGCQPADRSSGYVNPLAHATVKPKRIDQGVDYKGSGTLTAIGPARITEVALTDTGWPGAFIEYQLTGGPAAGCFVFYAEGVTPVPGLGVGQAIRAGQPVATLIDGYPDGIEIGWGAGIGTKTLAAQRGEWSYKNDSDSIPTGTGRSFSAMIAALGGVPGKVGG